MAEARWERLAAATGLAFPLLFVGAIAVVGDAVDELEDADPQVVAQQLLDNDVQIMIGTALTGLAAAALVWFAGSVRSALRPAERGTGRLSAVSFAGGVVGGSMLMLGGLLAALSVFQLADFMDDPQGATALYGVAGSVSFNALAFGIGLLVLPASIVGVRTRVLPLWLAWGGVVAGAALILGWWLWPVTMVAGILALLWIVAVSVLLIQREGTLQGA